MARNLKHGDHHEDVMHSSFLRLILAQSSHLITRHFLRALECLFCNSPPDKDRTDIFMRHRRIKIFYEIKFLKRHRYILVCLRLVRSCGELDFVIRSTQIFYSRTKFSVMCGVYGFH